MARQIKEVDERKRGKFMIYAMQICHHNQVRGNPHFEPVIMIQI